jgi:hypothetical protein
MRPPLVSQLPVASQYGLTFWSRHPPQMTGVYHFYRVQDLEPGRQELALISLLVVDKNAGFEHFRME